jgi:hypothetical protein
MQDQKQKCTGPEARSIIGVSDIKRERMKLPDTKWKYVFIQSTSRIRILSEGSHFMYCKCFQNNNEESLVYILLL